MPSSEATKQAIVTIAVEFTAPALQELRRVDRHLGVAATLAPGVTLLGLGSPFPRFAAALRAHPPVFVRHLCPVDQIVPLDDVGLQGIAPRRHGDTETDTERVVSIPAALLDVVRTLATRVDPARSFSVQTRLLGEEHWPFGPFDVNQALAQAIAEATGATLDVRRPEQVLSVVGVPGTLYVGLSDVEENLSAWAGGARRFAREPGQISRSEFKLLEALEVFGELRAESRLSALDLGAAPGGWTRVLRARGYRVVAVDPADMDPRVAADKGVRHVRTTAQRFLPSRETFDLIVNDMRMDARDSARIMLLAAPSLRPDGRALMTLKLPEEAPEQVMHQSLALLTRRYRILGARQLFHNRSEVTVALAR